MKGLILTTTQRQFLIDILQDCLEEFEQLNNDKEWFCSKVTEQIEEALEMLGETELNEIADWTKADSSNP